MITNGTIMFLLVKMFFGLGRAMKIVPVGKVMKSLLNLRIQEQSKNDQGNVFRKILYHVECKYILKIAP